MIAASQSVVNSPRHDSTHHRIAADELTATDACLRVFIQYVVAGAGKATIRVCVFQTAFHDGRQVSTVRYIGEESAVDNFLYHTSKWWTGAHTCAVSKEVARKTNSLNVNFDSCVASAQGL